MWMLGTADPELLWPDLLRDSELERRGEGGGEVEAGPQGTGPPGESGFYSVSSHPPGPPLQRARPAG